MRLLKEISKSEPTSSEPVQYSGGVTVISKKLLPQVDAPLLTGMFSTLMGLPVYTTGRYPLPADLFSIPVG